MKKEKTIRTYQRRTKTGKVVTVKQHTAKYDAAEALKEAAKKKGAGDELENLKKKVKPEKVKVEKPVEDAPDYGFTADEYKAWYHWDQDADPKNKSALKVEKALKKQMGTKAYNKYFDELTDSYSSRGHNKAFKGLGEKLSAGEDKKASTSASTKSVTPAKETKSVKGPKESTTLVAHVDGDNSIKYKVTPTSPMVKDVAFTKYLADDTYSETFPKGGSYEFFYAKRNKGGDVGLYAKRGNDIFELEETEPSKALAKKLGGSSSREKKSTFKETKADSSEYGKAPKHLGMTQQEWNDWMDGGAGYKAADKKAKAHLEKLYGKDGAKAIRKKYEGDGSNTYIDLVSKATADKKILSEIGGGSKSPKSFKHTDGGTSVEYDAAYAKMNKLISKHGGVPKKDHKDYAKYKEAEKYVNDFKAGKVGGTAKEVSPKVAKETKKLTERILGKKTPRRGSKAAYEAAQKAKASLTSYVDASPYKRILKSMNTYGGQVNKNELIGKLVKKGLSHAEASKIASQFSTKVKTEFTKSRQYRPGAK